MVRLDATLGRPGSSRAGFIIFSAVISHFAMKTSSFHKIASQCLPVALLLVAAGAHAQQDESIVLRCGDQAQHTTETGGYFINAQGEVVFHEEAIHCGPGGGGGPVPTVADPLTPQFTQAPTPTSITQLPATVAFTTQVDNYDHANAFFADVCTITARSPANQAITTLNLTPALGTGLSSGNLSFPAGLANGNYTVALTCSRSFQSGAQQVMVNNPAARTVNINVAGGGGPTPGPSCADNPIPSVFDSAIHFDYAADYNAGQGTGGWGNQPHEGTLARDWRHQITRNQQTGVISAMRLRYWTFKPEDNASAYIKLNNYGHSIVSISISECPGQFTSEQTRCARANSIVWGTGNKEASNKCNLEAGKTYYLNIAAFDYAEYSQTGQYKSNIDCNNCTTPYTVEPR